MAPNWWKGVGKAIDIVSSLAGSGGRAGAAEDDTALQPRGVLGGIEARLAGVLVSALHEAFARDAARLEAEREEAAAQRRQAELALRLEMARQEADHQLSQLRALIAIDVVVWLASLLFTLVHPPASVAAKILLAAAWVALTAGVAAAFVAYGRVAARAAAALSSEGADPGTRPGILEAASWLTVGGMGLAASALIAVLL